MAAYGSPFETVWGLTQKQKTYKSYMFVFKAAITPLNLFVPLPFLKKRHEN